MAKKVVDLKDKNGNVLIPNIFIDQDGTPSNTNTYNANAINELVKDVYSTEEKVIGTYLDKPLYRKTIITTCSELITELNNLNIKVLFDVKGRVDSNYNHIMFINAPNPEFPNYKFGIHQIKSDYRVELDYNSSYFGDSNNVECTVKYTKTTD